MGTVTQKNQTVQPPLTLVQGQIWRLPKGYLEIVKIGKNLAQYRRCLTEGQRGVPVAFATIAEVTTVLQENHAELVRPNPQ